MVRTAQPHEIEARQAVTALDLLHGFFDTCAAVRAIRLRRIVGKDVARLRAEARAAASVVGAEQQNVLGTQWGSVQREAEAVGALRAALAELREKVSAALVVLLAFALASAKAIDDTNRNTCTRAIAATLTKLHGLHHVALLSSRNAREVLAVG